MKVTEDAAEIYGDSESLLPTRIRANMALGRKLPANALNVRCSLSGNDMLMQKCNLAMNNPL